MRGSFHLGSIRGVPIEVHWLFAGVVGWAAFQGWGQATPSGNVFLALLNWLAQAQFSWAYFVNTWPMFSAGLSGAAWGVTLLLLVFGCVLIHEIGHTVHAQALGIPVRRILLLPIGGLAQLARMPEDPRDEMRVAFAGPAANLALALMCGALAWLEFALVPSDLSALDRLRAALTTPAPTFSGIVVYLLFVNVSLALFNLLPAFPMDGGRIARALLALKFSRRTATRAVSWCGALLGVACLLWGARVGWQWGWMFSLNFLLAGGFMLAGGAIEDQFEHSRVTLRQLLARHAVRQPTWTLAPTDRLLPEVVTTAFALGRTILPVVVGERLVGVVLRADVAASATAPEPPTVAHLMHTHFAYARAEEDLWHAQQVLLGAEANAIPVVEGDTLCGMLTLADIRLARETLPVVSVGEAPHFIAGGNLTYDAQKI